jgi:hypothetical protein
MEWVKVALDFFRDISWPLAICVIASWFKDDIREMLPRVKKAGPAGVEFNEVQQQQIVKRNEISFEDLKEFEHLPRTQFMGELERLVLNELKVINDEDKIPLLVRHLAQNRIELAAERVYWSIFGSQIRGLERLRDNGGRVSLDRARGFFAEVAEQFSDVYENVSFEQWFRFVQTQGLAIIENDEVVLTPFGSDFLTYLAARQLPRERLY